MLQKSQHTYFEEIILDQNSLRGSLTTGVGLDEPEEHAEEKGVEVDDVANCSGQVEELTPHLVLVRLPEHTEEEN